MKENRNYRHKNHQQIQEMEEKISGIEDTIEKILTQNIQGICDTRKRPNLKIIGIEGKDPQLKDPENTNS